ncbi:MAG: hypothetical protein AB7I79_16170 [Rhizobiaceae bacterium]
MRALTNLFDAWRADRGGNFALATAAVATVVVAAAGFGINAVQLHSARSQLLYALDAAVTSTARDLTTGTIAEKDARGSVESFLFSNVDGEAAVRLDGLVVDRQARTVSASAAMTVDLFFPVFGGSPTRTVVADSAALYSDKAIEVVMMLDVTGSMAGKKIEALKTAATNAVDAFLGGQDARNPRVRLSIVPYADAVNVGALARYVHYEKAFTSAEPPVWTGVTMASSGRNDIDLLPDGTRRGDRCATERKGDFRYSDASPASAMPSRDYRLEFCPAAILTPLTGDADALRATIDGFHAQGSTAGHIGIQWSWYMLSPRWREFLPASARPAQHDARRVAKIAILMTDGEFNTAFAGVGRNGDTTGGQASRSRDNAERLCDAMKLDGIELFTIGFMLKEAGAKAVMNDCASPDDTTRHYFETSSAEELNQAFLEIARNIESLALTR